MENALLTVEELASLLKVSKAWIYQHVRRRERDPLPHIKLGKYLRFSRSEVLNYLEKLKRTRSAPVSDGA